jgi:hypothetical protein
MKIRFIALLLSTVFIATTVVAGSGTDDVNQKVLATFLMKFNAARQVSWSRAGTMSKATFKLNDTYMYAYFAENGELMGMCRNLQLNELPINLQTALKKNMSASWITELFEYSTEYETVYYATLENAGRRVMLNSVGNVSWTSYKTIKKKS